MSSAGDGYVELPEGWTRVSASGPGPFVTSEVVRAPDGTEHRWESRRHRKRSPARRRGATDAAGRRGQSVWWRPRRRGWWMAVLFVIGALCFTAGGIASQWAATPRPWIGVISSSARCSSPRPPTCSTPRPSTSSAGSAPAGTAFAGGRRPGSQADRLAGDGRAADRNGSVQRQHVHRDEPQPDHASDQCARVGA